MSDRLVDHEPPRGVVAHVAACMRRGCAAAGSSVGHSSDVTMAAAAVELREARPRRPAAPTAPKVDSAARPAGPVRPLGRPDRACRTNSGAAHQPHPRTQLVDDAPRQQADQIRVARQPSVDAVEGVRRHRRPADVVRGARAPAPAVPRGPGRRPPPGRCGRRRRRRSRARGPRRSASGSPRPRRPGAPAPPADRRPVSRKRPPLPQQVPALVEGQLPIGAQALVLLGFARSHGAAACSAAPAPRRPAC